MTDIDNLLRQVFAEAKATAERLPPTATAEEVENAENILGFRLPQMLVRLYREVANGGFGPGYQILPLTGEGRSAVSDYREERTTRRSSATHWPAEILPILDWGCGMYAAVDCRTSEGTVLLFEPNGIDDAWHNAWYVDADSLTSWLQTWLAKVGWYEEDAAAHDETQEPRPWEMAQQRLSELE